MSKYLAVMKIAVLRTLQYKAFFLSSIISSIAKIVISLYVWKTIFAYQDQVNGYSATSFITYIIFASLLSNLNDYRMGRDLSSLIVRGQIAGELLKPYSLITSLFFQDLGFKVIELFKFSFILGLALAIQSHFFIPSIGTVLLFLLASLWGMFLVQLIDLNFSFLSFYTINTWGILILRNGLYTLASGAMLPLSFYPDGIRQLLQSLPYSYAVNFPLDILLERPISLQQIYGGLIWMPILGGISFFLWRYARRNISILGG